MSSSVEDLLKSINKKYGQGSVIIGDKAPKVPRQSSGILSLDLALGGGFGKGRIVEVFGGESSGKTTVSIHAMVQAQKDQPEKLVGIIDAEHALDPEYCQNLGLDLSKVAFCQPNSGEEGTQVCVEFVKSGLFSFILIDSVAALTPQSTIESDMEGVEMAVHARMISKFLKKVTSEANTTGTTLYLTNQTRNKIGTYGNPTVTTGGEAPKFYASQRVELKSTKGDTEGGEVVNKVTNVTIIKNKLGAPYKKCTLRINFGTGIDRVRDMFETALSLGIIEVSGRTYTLFGSKLSSKSYDDAFQTFKDTEELHQQVYLKCINSLKHEQFEITDEPSDVINEEGSF